MKRVHLRQRHVRLIGLTDMISRVEKSGKLTWLLFSFLFYKSTQIPDIQVQIRILTVKTKQLVPQSFPCVFVSSKRTDVSCQQLRKWTKSPGTACFILAALLYSTYGFLYNPQLAQEVQFIFSIWSSWPLGVLLINFFTSWPLLCLCFMTMKRYRCTAYTSQLLFSHCYTHQQLVVSTKNVAVHQ